MVADVSYLFSISFFKLISITLVLNSSDQHLSLFLCILMLKCVLTSTKPKLFLFLFQISQVFSMTFKYGLFSSFKYLFTFQCSLLRDYLVSLISFHALSQSAQSQDRSFTDIIELRLRPNMEAHLFSPHMFFSCISTFVIFIASFPLQTPVS